MRLTYLAHASLLVEAGGVRLLTDPWLDGPTYLSAWWHFPEPALHAAELGPIDYVYITHEHVDHFHEPTLARLPKKTPILIGKFLSPRFRRRLCDIGFEQVRELPHGVKIPLGDDGMQVTSYQYRADDTALVVEDGQATLLNLNDCLLRGRSLHQLLSQHGPIDLLAASFANAEAYPIVYDFEDPGERIDWDDASRFNAFLDKVRQISPSAFVPFASMFCFLSQDLFAINERIVSPAGLIERAAAGAVAARPLALNPGDVWTPQGGHERRSDVDWSAKNVLLERYARQHADEIRALAAQEVVPGGRQELAARFRSFFAGFAERIPSLLGRKLDLAIRWDVEGPAGGTFWLRFARGKLEPVPPSNGDSWDVRITTRDWPLWRALVRKDSWQSFGISCRFRVFLRKGMRQREVFFWFLLYLDDMGYLEPTRLLSWRTGGVMLRRYRELLEYAGSALGGGFVDHALRGKFDS